MAWRYFKDLVENTASDKILPDRAFNIAKNPNYDGCRRGIASMVYKVFDKNSTGSGIKIKNMLNQDLTGELHKPIIKKIKKFKLYSSFKDNIWAATFADMQLINTFSKVIRFLLCVIDILSKYAQVIPLKTKKRNYNYLWFSKSVSWIKS